MKLPSDKTATIIIIIATLGLMTSIIADNKLSWYTNGMVIELGAATIMLSILLYHRNKQIEKYITVTGTRIKNHVACRIKPRMKINT